MKLTVLNSETDVTRVESADDITIVDFQGKGDPLEQLLGPGAYRGKVLLSLARSCYVDSAGVGWLIMCHKRFTEAGGRLVIHSIPPMVCHGFRLLELETVLNLASDEATAFQQVQSSGSV